MDNQNILSFHSSMFVNIYSSSNSYAVYMFFKMYSIFVVSYSIVYSNPDCNKQNGWPLMSYIFTLLINMIRMKIYYNIRHLQYCICNIINAVLMNFNFGTVLYFCINIYELKRCTNI